jgi:glycosyltransferase involved in cell wall biosynthesis
MNPLVSIAIITYNQVNFIADAIDGALQQDYSNLQIVVADDGSTDGTDRVVREYACKHPLKVIAITGGPNLGITGNSNRVLAACRGEYIAFLGGDDVLLPGKISKQVEWFRCDESRVLCGHQVEIFYESGAKSRDYHRTMFWVGGRGASKVIRFGVPYCACAIMLKASAIPRHGFAKEIPHCSDFVLWAESLASGGSYGHVSGTYARYRRHSGNITTSVEKYIPELEAAINLLATRYPVYKKDCAYAMGSLSQYGYGCLSMQKGNYRQAIGRFALALRIYPHYWKTWLRLTQAIVSGALRLLSLR